MARKYSQRGYQEDDRRERPRRPKGRRAPGDAPRGRGLGAPGTVVLRCRACGTRIEASIETDSTCDSCGAALHTCTHCRHYDTAALDECRIEEAPPVRAKSKANECGWFEARRSVESDGAADNKPGNAKSEFDSLFDF